MLWVLIRISSPRRGDSNEHFYEDLTKNYLSIIIKYHQLRTLFSSSGYTHNPPSYVFIKFEAPEASIVFKACTDPEGGGGWQRSRPPIDFPGYGFLNGKTLSDPSWSEAGPPTP